MKYNSCTLLIVALIGGSADVAQASNGATIVDLPGKLVNGVRRHLNFNGLLGSPTRPTNSASHTSYEKIMGHPVFQVTTSWGSAYMNMEKLTLEDAETNSDKMLASGSEDASSFGAEDSQYRTISLYYMDPNDAIGAHAEFKQMDGMQEADVRITSVSLAKAIRSAANLGRGLLTGQPIDYHKGTVLPTKEGGSLRHKIMPPKKQIYYAARCHGRERIGLFGKGEGATADRDSRYDQAVAAVIGNAALAYRNSQRKQAIRDRKLAYKPKSQLEADYQHMDGHLGIPVFYAPGMERRRSRIKSLVSGSQRKEIPLFFNYEDLQEAWQKTRPLGGDKNKGLPSQPMGVEVFNLWDVLTSVEKEQTRKAQHFHNLKPQDKLLSAISHPFVNRWRNVAPKDTSGDGNNLLDALVFIPSSDACTYKEKITARGDGKARLRPMR
mmetsp:Transcript_12399/g.25610  ORF Transcript_12399/g.25610 Transcript_12399/m.25610 type:complete len:438 (-) Transcript_12399:30-1343(-)|eukprot:CAMPEP_0197279468 /NCGR_PEP_ID=MMETSP1432-20130617/20129_1 /TAXON_ID=44447 /ORGANISM="Pseudo-nitzschia delicatissima, Strain UNC1205" /LENGTH=437 /DNA_ID=CAMNT_0042746013 /DNA_START=35 /DNA_END=1348 /DNA_ORIENTATION=-